MLALICNAITRDADVRDDSACMRMLCLFSQGYTYGASVVVQCSGYITDIAMIYNNAAVDMVSDTKHRRRFVHIAQLYWPRCIQVLRCLPIPTQLLESWEAMARALKLKEAHEFPPDYRYRWQGHKPCYLDDCLCSQMRPKHPMRVCKGCWRAYYCSVRCQTL